LNIKIISRDGEAIEVFASLGASLMEVIRSSSNDELMALCGGCCSCATCHVYIDDAYLDQLTEMSEDESDLLDSSSHRRDNSRLSCQIRVLSELEGMAVSIAPED
jgi:2Fe-2S ferredoxin